MTTLKRLSLLLSLALLAGYLLIPRPTDRFSVGSERITHEIGNAYSVPELSPASLLWRYQSDDFQNPVRADLQLYENGVLLSPAHSTHEEIRNAGGGKYSFWEGQLYFSASDNSSPLENGRNYVVEVVRFTEPGIFWVLLLSTLVSLVVLCNLAPTLRILGGLAFSSSALLLVMFVAIDSKFISLSTSLDFTSEDLEPAPSYYTETEGEGYMLTVPVFLRPFVRIDYSVKDKEVWCKTGSFRLDGRPLTRNPNAGISGPRDDQKQASGWFDCRPPYVIFKAPAKTPIRSDSIISFRVPLLITDSAFAVLAIIGSIGALAWLAGRSHRPILFIASWSGRFAVISAFLLLAVNVFGVTQSLRSPKIDPDTWEPGMTTHGEDDVKLTFSEALELIDAYEGKDARTLVRAYLSIVTDAMGHSWQQELAAVHNIRVPIWENYILWFFGGVSERFYMYAFADSQKALERGVGICSHLSLVLVDLLSANDIDAKLVGLDGHVVVTARVGDEEWHVLDPDYGVYIPYSLSDLERSPDIVRKYYSPRLGKTFGVHRGHQITEDVVGFYRADGNALTDPSSSTYYERLTRTEVLLYQSKWLFPVDLAFLGSLLLLMCVAFATRINPP